jgi:hypothetical protein
LKLLISEASSLVKIYINGDSKLSSGAIARSRRQVIDDNRAKYYFNVWRVVPLKFKIGDRPFAGSAMKYLLTTACGV